MIFLSLSQKLQKYTYNSNNTMIKLYTKKDKFVLVEFDHSAKKDVDKF